MLAALLQQALSRFDAEQLVDLLAQGGIVAGKIRTMDQIHPGQAGLSADLFVNVQAPQREAIRVPGLPITLAGVQRQSGHLPALGEHTDEVLAQWGVG